MGKSTSKMVHSIICDYQTIMKMHRNVVSLVDGMIKVHSQESFKVINSSPLPLEAVDSIVDSMQILLWKQRKYIRKINFYFSLKIAKASINSRMVPSQKNKSQTTVCQHNEVFCQLVNANLSLILFILKERSTYEKSTLTNVGQEMEYLRFIIERLVEGLSEATTIGEYVRIPCISVGSQMLVFFLAFNGISIASYQTINGKIVQILALLERIHRQIGWKDEYLRKKLLFFRQFLLLRMEGSTINRTKRKYFNNYKAPTPWFSNNSLNQYGNK